MQKFKNREKVEISDFESNFENTYFCTYKGQSKKVEVWKYFEFMLPEMSLSQKAKNVKSIFMGENLVYNYERKICLI